MVYQFRTFRRVFLQGAFDVDLGQGVVALYEEYPCVCVQIGRIVRFELDALGAHAFRLFQVFFIQGKEIRVVIEDNDVVVVVFQCLVVSLVCLVHLFHLIVDVADLSVEIGFKPGIIRRDDVDTCIVGVQGLLVFLLLVISDTQIEIIFGCIREQFLAFGTDTDHFGNIFGFQRHIQQLLPGGGVFGLHLCDKLELETGLVRFPLRDQEAAVHLFQVGVFRMLFEQCLEQSVGAVRPFLRLLQLQDITGEDGDFGVYVEFFIDQGVAYLRFGGILVAGRFVVVGHRDDVVRVTRVDLMGFLVVGAGLYRVVLFQVKVT